MLSQRQHNIPQEHRGNTPDQREYSKKVITRIFKYKNNTSFSIGRVIF